MEERLDLMTIFYYFVKGTDQFLQYLF
jgi:hypothetical protein